MNTEIKTVCPSCGAIVAACEAFESTSAQPPRNPFSGNTELQRVRSQLDQVTAQRDELRAALKGMINAFAWDVEKANLALIRCSQTFSERISPEKAND